MLTIAVIGLIVFSILFAFVLYVTYDVIVNYSERDKLLDIALTGSYSTVPWGKLGFIFLVWLGFLIMVVQVSR